MKKLDTGKKTDFMPHLMTETTEHTEKRQTRTPMTLNFTDTHILARFVTETGKILPRRVTGLTARQQRHVSNCIKRARNMLLMK